MYRFIVVIMLLLTQSASAQLINGICCKSFIFYTPDFIFYSDPTKSELCFNNDPFSFPSGITTVIMQGGSQSGNSFSISSITVDEFNILRVAVVGNPLAPTTGCFSSCPPFTVN